MSDTLILESVRERDIDLLFLEEWNVNIEFAKWFVKKVLSLNIEIEKTEGLHSIIQDNLGETDLFLCYYENKVESVLLLENKIDALAQDEQGNRYSKRSKILINSGKYKNVNTCILAPLHYLANNEEVKYYEYKISYEDIRDYLASYSNSRLKYKANVIELAIEQERRGYTANPDPIVTQFWHDYWDNIKTRVPSIYMKEPYSIPEGSDWPILSFDWMPFKWVMRHKLTVGNIDLETRLNEKDIDELKKQLVGSKFSIVKTGKSYSIRAKVLPMDRHKPLLTQYKEFESTVSTLESFDKNSKLFILNSNG